MLIMYPIQDRDPNQKLHMEIILDPIENIGVDTRTISAGQTDI